MTSCSMCCNQKQQCDLPKTPPVGDDVVVSIREKMAPMAGRKCESLEVTHEANELWKWDLKLHEQQLKVAEKQLAGNSHLVEVVQVLMSTLDQTSLGDVLAHGQAGGSRSMQKGKEWAGMEGGSEESDKDGEDDAEGEKEDSKGGEDD